MVKGKPFPRIFSARGSVVHRHHLLLEGITKASLAPSTTLDENPRSSARVVAAIRCYPLLEDASLERTTCCSSEMAGRPSSCRLWQSLLLVLHLGVFSARGTGLPFFSFVDSGGDDPGGAILGGVVRLGGVPCVLACQCPQLRPNTSARLECARPLRLCPSGVLL